MKGMDGICLSTSPLKRHNQSQGSDRNFHKQIAKRRYCLEVWLICHHKFNEFSISLMSDRYHK